jgi:hypothetical protein
MTVELEDAVARHVEESARRERKSVSEWIADRVKSEADSLAAMEAHALANGYPSNWLTLFGSLVGDDSFCAPSRGAGRAIERLDKD